MFFRAVFLLSFLALVGCQKGALYIQQQKVTSTYLASTNVGSPDPRTPPSGQLLLAEWWIPAKIRAQQPFLRLHIVFQDTTSTCVEYPIRSMAGYETYFLVNKEFKKKGGFQSYKGEIVTQDGTVYADFTHQLWVEIINLDDTERTNCAVSEKSRQPSVIETPLCRSSK